MVDDVVAQLAPLSPLLTLAGAVVLGLVVDRFALKQVYRLTSRTRWGYDDVVVRALDGTIVLWFALAGASLTALQLPVSETTAALLRRATLVVGISSVTIVCARISVGWFGLYTRSLRGILPATSLFSNMLAVLVYTIGILVILQSLSISVTPILTAMGVGGLAVALALQDTLSNLFAGLHIIVSRKVRIGEYVKLDSGEEGVVADITWRNTTIDELRGNTIIVPNAKLSSAILTNYNRPETYVSCLLPLSVSYDSDLERVEAVTVAEAKAVMEELPGMASDFEPVVRFKAFGDSGIEFNLVVRAREFLDQYAIRHHMIKRLHRRYREEGIEIPFPARTVYVRPASGQPDPSEQSPHSS
jgi:small-conductance mechanosensitive channel